MRLKTIAVVTAVALATLILPATARPADAPARVIVTFRSGPVDRAVLAGIERLGGTKIKELPLIGGAVFMLPARAAERAVAHMDGVESVERDLIVTALARPVKPAPVQPDEVLPWGITRIHANDVWTFDTADPVKVAVIDTGIDVAHPDLVDNLKGGMSAVGYTTAYSDDNGHGTHVAGIIAAVDNAIGAVGVGPDADLYAVKVLNKKGSGWVSDIIEGLQWCIDNDIDVVNMSLGSRSSSTDFATAVQATLDAGVVVVAAAGNSGPGADTVEYPGAYPGVIAVGATDSSDHIASWSSRGSQVAVSAPGVSVFSTYKGSWYATMSGTSMASPHVAGVAALMLAEDPTATPAEVRQKLVDEAQDLGAPGFDSSFGYGLVQADLAVAR